MSEVRAKANKDSVRATEREYLAILSDKLTLARWSKIVERALSDAEKGDARAREWVTRFALGREPMTLFNLARLEVLGITPAHQIEAAADATVNPGSITLISESLGGMSVERRAYMLARDGERNGLERNHSQ